MRFYLGTHMPEWLTRVEVPLFVSHRRLAQRRRLPQALTAWALDSGAFTDIALRGEFTDTPADYVDAIARYAAEIGRLEWAAPQDHMTEPFVLARSTIATTVNAAQGWTTDNVAELRALDPPVPVIAVLQGQTIGDYLRHAERYERAGIDLAAEELVGLGSVCRRQATDEIGNIVATLGAVYRLHGFGVKSAGLRRYGWCLTSADSMAWSYRGRRIRPCPHRGTVSCANCMTHALEWRRRAIADTERRSVQLALDFGEPCHTPALP